MKERPIDRGLTGDLIALTLILRVDVSWSWFNIPINGLPGVRSVCVREICARQHFDCSITLNFKNYGYYVKRHSGGWCNVQLLQIREADDDDEGQKSPLLRGSGLSLSGPPVVSQVWPYGHFPSCHAWACCSGRQGSRCPSRDVFTVPLHYPNSTPLSKIASDQWGFPFPASIDVSPSDSLISHKHNLSA